MKKPGIAITVFVALLLAGSCDEPETVVTNIVHPDGSVTRKIEMRNTKNNFKPSEVQVPFDSTWTVKDSIFVGEKKDTTWFKTAVKNFASVDEINQSYKMGKDKNSEVNRSAAFTRSFRWFRTVYRYSEKIEASLSYGYKPEKFLGSNEMEWFRLPAKVAGERLEGADSLKYKDLQKRTEDLSNQYFWNSIISEWIEEFSKLASSEGKQGPSAAVLREKEKIVADSLILGKNNNDTTLIILLIGPDNYRKFRTEADSASSLVDKRLEKNLSFTSYTDVFIMPGKLTGTNGFIGGDGSVTWPVRSEFFLSVPCEMWAESSVTNLWTWIVSGLFLVFVIAGLARRKNKKG